MRRVLRHLLTLCSAASLLLCVTVCVLWVRSYFVSDALADGWVNDPPTSGAYVQACSNRGAILLQWFDVAVHGSAPPWHNVGLFIQLDTPPAPLWTTADPFPWSQRRYRYLMGFSRLDDKWVSQPTAFVKHVEHNRKVTFP